VFDHLHLLDDFDGHLNGSNHFHLFDHLDFLDDGNVFDDFDDFRVFCPLDRLFLKRWKNLWDPFVFEELGVDCAESDCN
jgi:hypothetical protein